MKSEVTRESGQAESGQAVVEYLLTLATVIALLVGLQTGFRKIIFSFWKQIACDVSAACVNCPPPETVRNAPSGKCRGF